MTADPTWKGMPLDAETALALLEWQREMGVDEPIGDAPVDRYAEPLRPPGAAPGPAPAAPPPPAAEPLLGQAQAMAARARTLAELSEIQSGFEGLEIRRGARNFVFADGHPGARVMILGEAPGEEEDRQGRPFVGRAGQLLDRMFDAIGLSRRAVDAEKALYITNVLTWRPPGNRDPQPDEIAMSLPFVRRHIDLVAPELIVLMGNIACDAGLGRRGILRLRGNWAQAFGRPALPMTHPAYLLRNPPAKREAWADLLSLAARLEGTGGR